MIPAALRRGWCPSLRHPMETGDGLLVRVHPPQGRLTAAQARAVAAAARDHGNGRIDVTGRANLQLRGVRDPEALAERMEAVGLGDARERGGPQRLTVTSPLAGLHPREILDGLDLARRIEALPLPPLPPKTLVAVDGGCGFRHPDADLTLSAVAPDRLLLSLSAEPLGTVSLVAAPEAVARLLALFARAEPGTDLPGEGATPSPYPLPIGERGLPPRLRDLDASARHHLREALAPLLGSPRPLDFPFEAGFRPSPRDEGEGGRGRVHSEPDTRRNVDPPGLVPLRGGTVAVLAECPFGRWDCDGLARAAAWSERHGDGTLRLSAGRGFAVAGVDEAEAASLRDSMDRAGLIVAGDDPRRRVVACPGAPACGRGTTPTLADAARLAPLLARLGLTAHVSGCPKGCAHPGPAPLTLVGERGAYRLVRDGRAADAGGDVRPLESILAALSAERPAAPTREALPA